MNAIILAVLVMLILAMLRVHVVLSLFVGALAGGLSAGLGISRTMVAFQDGLAAGAKIALSYALLGAFAMAVAHSGLPQLLANWLIARIETEDGSTSKRAVRMTTMLLLGGLTAMAVMSQNLIPVHIAFIPLVVPPLLIVMSRLQLDRRAVTCAITFGLVTTYMFLPLGFGRVFLHDILYANIKDAGLDVSHISATHAMGSRRWAWLWACSSPCSSPTASPVPTGSTPAVTPARARRSPVPPRSTAARWRSH